MRNFKSKLQTLKENLARAKARQAEEQSNWFYRVFYKTKRRIMASPYGRGLCKAWEWAKLIAVTVSVCKAVYALAFFITWAISVI